MNRGVLRTDADLRNEDGAALLWTGTNSGVQVTPVAAGPVMGASVSWPASANTLTSWTEITSSSPFACCAIDVYFSGHYQNAADTELLFDIGTGSGGSETVLIDGIPSFGHSRFLCVRFPVRVAAGTRFAFRVQAVTAAGSLTSPADPTVALGFIRDIPEFPAGTSVQTIGPINRAASRYTNSTNTTFGQARQVWFKLGDVPAGKMIYAIPFSTGYSSGQSVSATFSDFGWDPTTGLTFDELVPPPDFVFASDVFLYTDSSENANPVIPTVWVPDGLVGGSISVARDTAHALYRIQTAVFAVME